MAAADRMSGNVRDQLDRLTVVSKLATEALQKIRMTTAQAAETTAVAESMKRSVSGVTDAAMRAADHLADVKLSQVSAAETRLAADEEIRSLKRVEDQALRTRAATGGGGPGMFGMGRGVLLPAAIGLGIAAAPALGPAALGIAGLGLAGGATAIGGLGTAYAAFSGLSAAIGGNKKAFDALNESQKQFVQTLRSLNLGLDEVASKALLPGLTKALHEMFSPTLVAALTQAVREFGTAMGQAGQIVGRYFGSNQFAGLMQAIAPQAAGGIKDLARVFVSVADALGHVTQAALPFTRWLGDVTAKGAKLFDTWVRGAQAGGGLAHAFDLAKQSLQALGGLVSSVGGAIHALLNAIGGFSTGVAVINLLKRALDGVAAFLTANRTVLSSVFSGLVKSANDAITVVGGLLKALHPLLSLINAIAKDFGGWRPIIDAVATVFVAKMALSIGWVGRLAKSLVAVGPAATAGAAEADGALAGIGAAATAALVPVSALLAALGAAWAYYKFLSSHKAYAGGPGQGMIEPKKGGPIYAIGGGHVAGMNYPGAQAAAAARLGVTLNPAVPLPHGVGFLTAGGQNIGPPPPTPLVPHIFGTSPPFTSGLGGGGGGSRNVIPTAANSQANIASTYENLAQQLNNTGATAKKYLDDELIALTKEWEILRDKAATSTGKTKAELDKSVTEVANKMRDVGTLIADAVIVSGSALLNSGLRSKLANLSAQFKADSDYAAVLTGQAADDYRKVLKADLTAQAGALEQAVAELKSRLAGADQKHRAAINAEIKSLEGQLTQVQDQVVSILQQNVQALQQQVSTIFTSVQQEMDTALGNLYYQNGLKTPSELLLSQMQSADQLQSLQDAIDQAQQQLQTDTAGALQKHVLDVATGKQWDVFNPAASKQIAADQKALDAAKRQLDEYNLSIKAAQERSQADQAYAQQVQSLNARLAQWEQSILNGTGSMQGLKDIAAQFGIQINTQTVPDFKSLSDTITGPNGLMQAFADLAAYIEKITGHNPTLPPGSTGNSPAGTGGSYTTTGGYKPYIQIPIPGHPVAMAKGGIVKATPGGKVIVAGEAGHDEAIVPLDGRRLGGDGITVNVTVNGSVIGTTAEEFARQMTPTIRRELYRVKSRNSRSLDF